MRNIIDIDRAKRFLESVRKYDSPGKGVAAQIVLAANQCVDDRRRSAAAVGVAWYTMFEWETGLRDMRSAKAVQLRRIAGYLGVDIGVLQIAVGNLLVCDFQPFDGERPCKWVDTGAHTWLKTEYAMGLAKLSAEFGFESGRESLPEHLPLCGGKRGEADAQWSIVESETLMCKRGHTLLEWISGVGRAVGCTPSQMCQHLRKPVTFVHFLYYSRTSVAVLSPRDIRVLARFLGVPSAAAMAAAGQFSNLKMIQGPCMGFPY